MDEDRPEKRVRTEEEKPNVKSYQHLFEGKCEFICINKVSSGSNGRRQMRV